MIEDRIKERRTLILQNAEKLFADKGFYKTEVEEIARQAGISKGTVYNYFQSKEEILLSIIESGLKELEDQMRNGIRDIECPVEAIRMGIKIYLNYWKKNIPLYKVLIFEHIKLKVDLENEYYSKIFARTVHIEQLIDKAIELKKFKNIDPYIAATALNGMIDFMMYRGLLENVNLSTDYMADQISRLFLDGILEH